MAWGETAPQPQSIPNTVDPANLTENDSVVQVEAHEAVPETDEQRKRRQNDETQTWLEAKNAAVTAVETERAARSVLSKSFFPKPTKGTQYAPLGGGWRLKLVFGYTYTLGDKDKLDEDNEKIPVAKQVEELEDQIRALGEQGDSIVNRCIRWKPELVEREYLALKETTATTAEHAAFDLITEMLTIGEKSPTLEMVEPTQPKGKAAA